MTERRDPSLRDLLEKIKQQGVGVDTQECGEHLSFEEDHGHLPELKESDKQDEDEEYYLVNRGSQTESSWIFQALEEMDDPFCPSENGLPKELETEEEREFQFAEPERPPVNEKSQPLIDYLTRMPEGIEELESAPSNQVAQFLLGHGGLPKPSPLYILDHCWDTFYVECPKFQTFWNQVQKPEEEWPHQWQLRDGKLYNLHFLCVPTGLGIKIVAAYHQKTGHCGIRRTLEGLKSQFLFGVEKPLPWMVAQVKKHCVVCQATEHPNWLVKSHLLMTSIPPRVMTSICVDVFTLPATEWRGVLYDCMLVCLDRLRGWITPIQTIKEGLTGEKAADLLIDKDWYIFWDSDLDFLRPRATIRFTVVSYSMW